MTKASATRLDILQKAFELIYTKGYQTTSIDDIIATTHVTKGAFYYHFKSKDEMGMAIINDVLKPTMMQAFIGPLQNSANPVKDIYNMMQHLLLNHPYLQVAYGCPAGNLAHEMTPWNEEFSTALGALVAEWQRTIEACIKRGKRAGLIRKNVQAVQVSYFIMAGYWGIRNFGKLHNSDECYRVYLRELKRYLDNLRQTS
jgi:TetR/AcrR family transcriptional repressor of nem operon